MWLNVWLAGVPVAAGVALGDGAGTVGVSLAGMLVAVAVAFGVIDGAGVGVEGVQAALIVAANVKITSAIDFLVMLLLGL